MCGAPGALGEAQPFRPGCFELGSTQSTPFYRPQSTPLALPNMGKGRAKAGDQGSKVGSLLLRQKQGRRFFLIKLSTTNFHILSQESSPSILSAAPAPAHTLINIGSPSRRELAEASTKIGFLL